MAIEVSNFALQYNNADASFAAFSASSIDLLITEASPFGSPANRLTDAHLATLTGQGRAVVGYVNVSVTDDARPYWNPAWTTNGRDTGDPTAAAPDWLDDSVPLDFDGAVPGPDARIVEYWDPAWQQIVIDQAVEIIRLGYSGVFLDDIGRYFQMGAAAGSVAVAADRMIALVRAVGDAVRAIDPDAIVIANADPYLLTNSSTGGNLASAQARGYLDAVDFQLLENQTAAVVDYAQQYLPDEPILLLQSGPDRIYTPATAAADGIVLYDAPSSAYDSFVPTPYATGAGNDAVTGGSGPNRIAGGAGDDRLSGRAGNDGLLGEAGNDALYGGAGADTLTGGAGNDRYYVETAGDQTIEAADGGSDAVYATIDWTLAANIETLYVSGNAVAGTGNALANTLVGANRANVLSGSGGNDTIRGNNGTDTLDGGDGDDILWGGALRDTLTGGAGADDFRFQAGDTSPLLAQADRITDFSHAQRDQIFLNLIDANTAAAGDQAFAFIGTAAFSGVAGQLRAYGSGGDTIIAGDTNGDGSADLYLRLSGSPTIVAADLVL